MANSSMNTSASRTTTTCPFLFVEGLGLRVTEASLYDTFSLAGAIRSVQICRDITTGRSLGCAYVSFDHPAEAERALDAYNFYGVWGRRPRISSAQPQPVGKVIIKNLEESIDSEALNDTMSVFGNVLSCQVVANGSRNYAVVRFQTQEAADRAIDRLNGLMFNDQQVFVARFASSMVPQPQTVGPRRPAPQVPRRIAAHLAAIQNMGSRRPRPASVAPVGGVSQQNGASGVGDTQLQTATPRIVAQLAAIQNMATRRPHPAPVAPVGGVPQQTEVAGVNDTQRQTAVPWIVAQLSALRNIAPRRLRPPATAPIASVVEVPQQTDAAVVGVTRQQTARQRIAAQRTAIQSLGPRSFRPPATAPVASVGGVPQQTEAAGVGDTQRQTAAQRIAAQRAALRNMGPRRLRPASAVPVGGVPPQSDATGIGNIPLSMPAVQRDMTAPAA